MNTFPVHAWARPSSSRVKKREHFAFAGVAHGSRVKPPKRRLSSSNNDRGVSHSSVALEKCTRTEANCDEGRSVSVLGVAVIAPPRSARGILPPRAVCLLLRLLCCGGE